MTKMFFRKKNGRKLNENVDTGNYIKKRFVSGFALRRCFRDDCTQTSLLPAGTAATPALRADKTR